MQKCYFDYSWCFTFQLIIHIQHNTSMWNTAPFTLCRCSVLTSRWRWKVTEKVAYEICVGRELSWCDWFIDKKVLWSLITWFLPKYSLYKLERYVSQIYTCTRLDYTETIWYDMKRLQSYKKICKSSKTTLLNRVHTFLNLRLDELNVI